jgi:hypothetical protein
MPGLYLKLILDLFLPYPLQFINHSTIRRYVISATNNSRHKQINKTLNFSLLGLINITNEFPTCCMKLMLSFASVRTSDRPNTQSPLIECQVQFPISSPSLGRLILMSASRRQTYFPVEATFRPVEPVSLGTSHTHSGYLACRIVALSLTAVLMS